MPAPFTPRPDARGELFLTTKHSETVTVSEVTEDTVVLLRTEGHHDYRSLPNTSTDLFTLVLDHDTDWQPWPVHLPPAHTRPTEHEYALELLRYDIFATHPERLAAARTLAAATSLDILAERCRTTLTPPADQPDLHDHLAYLNAVLTPYGARAVWHGGIVIPTDHPDITADVHQMICGLYHSTTTRHPDGSAVTRLTLAKETA